MAKVSAPWSAKHGHEPYSALFDPFNAAKPSDALYLDKKTTYMLKVNEDRFGKDHFAVVVDRKDEEARLPFLVVVEEVRSGGGEL